IGESNMGAGHFMPRDNKVMELSATMLYEGVGAGISQRAEAAERHGEPQCHSGGCNLLPCRCPWALRLPASPPSGGAEERGDIRSVHSRRSRERFLCCYAAAATSHPPQLKPWSHPLFCSAYKPGV
ncbi:unnamed protein product, partial [Closterium sp. NIES-53]